MKILYRTFLRGIFRKHIFLLIGSRNSAFCLLLSNPSLISGAFGQTKYCRRHHPSPPIPRETVCRRNKYVPPTYLYLWHISIFGGATISWSTFKDSLKRCFVNISGHEKSSHRLTYKLLSGELHNIWIQVVYSLNANLLEVEVFEWEVDLHDAGGLHPGPQDVLLCRLVVLRTQPVQVVQETRQKY